VGDASFQLKSSQRMTELIGAGASVVLVSHQLQQIVDRCDRVIWLEHGVMKALGPPGEVVAAYAESVGVPVELNDAGAGSGGADPVSGPSAM